MAQIMREDFSSLDMLRNNAKTIGGILGAEQGFFEGKKYQDEYFVEKDLL
jgi:hypothetical protein